MKQTAIYPKPEGFEMEDDSRILIGNRFRGVSGVRPPPPKRRPQQGPSTRRKRPRDGY